ncbi:phosphate ABC transporter permease PstA [Ethanoligenens harbinense]|uniref:Phosphate transport system permease protein PstA n=1 Tax=Ethanoligenens harbinense (strain DSM 18485 / JCM 12961 / CGMCC 1.5033 / YUAN-3) TaxID=663278 RepID=E6U798_ETHHY|nr:phosphate ABC transporter permease PstA [Ethanoligenens harbinense]ADU25833.1 phosphate ABC transporter, inner membrane subunit PstA [Ethanoligenens harbinense YUAN-3]AVQ94994.1 phosphate ABC transporter, permease protein PstA [Ethanoligenens harbinense YUAN-3]AYF37686.1 phosphate ABC transporter, permease protein PstA [Ethanoligenens harbinense]AYF40406.1 phosphate ABC transporter, permease protein PstA [Ethanoligenens harbinense]QCN91241.1 phosphate ABC transporter permease PtsA [Ethanoli
MSTSAAKVKSATKAQRADHVATGVLYGVAGFFLLLLGAFTIYILFRGGRAAMILTAAHSTGIGAQLFNTVYLVILSLLISTPIGICAGIYMAEYMQEGRLSSFIRTCIETLSSLPSIVVGLFGYLVFLVMTHSSYNLVAGALAVSILNLPLVTTTTEDALRAIPKYYKEGSLGIGATHWQTIARVLLPASIPRIITGVILAGGRAFGEAAALLYIVGTGTDIRFGNWNITSPMSPLNPFRSGETLSMHIWDMNTNPSVPHAGEQADVSAAILTIMVFVFSLGARFIGNALERKMTGNKQ